MKTCIFFALVGVGATVLAYDDKTIDIGGPRKVSATISEAGDDYEIKVSIIPVRCFDAGMNRKLSQEKARLFVTEAIIRHLGGSSKRHSATIRNAEIIEAGFVDSRFVLVMRVPRKGVQFVESQNARTESKPLEGSTRRSLLKAKDDFQDTLEIIAKTLADDTPMFNGKLEEFYEAVADAEEIGVNRLKSLTKEIKGDRLLLSTERDELLQAVVTEEEHFVNRLRKKVEEVEGNNKEKE